MGYKAEKVGNVKELGDIYRVDAPLDEQLRAFGMIGINTLVTPEEIAQIRLVGVADNWSRTNVAPIAVKGGKTILIKNSPLMNPLLSTSAVKAHRNGQYLQVGKEVYDVADETAKAQSGMEPEDRDAITVSQNGDFGFSVGMDETRFLLGKTAQRYFEKFVKGGSIPFYNLSGTAKDSATVNYLWFYGPQGGSNLDAGSRSLDIGDGAFGVLKTGGASAQKNGYSLTEIGNANSEVVQVHFTGLGAEMAKNMSRVLTSSLVDKLRK